MWLWRARRDSNPRPLGPQPNALSTELRAHECWGLAEREGFEPSMQVTPHGGLANRCTRPLCDLSEASAADMLPRGTRRSGPGRPAGPRRPIRIDSGVLVGYRQGTHMSDVFYFRCPA